MAMVMTKKMTLLVVLFVVSYVFFMLQQLPANQLMRWMPQHSPVRLNDIRGTIWNGQAGQVHINGFSISNLSWRLQAWPLLLGNIALGVKFRQADAFGQGQLRTGYNAQHVMLTAVRGSFPAANLMPLFYGYPIALAGQVTANIQQATLRPGQQLMLQGELLWREAALTAPQAITLGDLQVKMQPKGSGTVLTVQDQGGPLQLDGQVTVQGNGSYETNISVAARSSADRTLAQSISILGQRDAQGNVHISQRGRLPGW